MNFLYWNIAKISNPDIIAEIVRDYNIEVLILSEVNVKVTELILKLNTGNEKKFYLQFNPLDEPIILAKYKKDLITPVDDFERMSIRQFTHPLGFTFTLAVVHLPSQMYFKEVDQIQFSTRIAKQILESELKVGHQKTIIVGDFNMNPFAAGIIGSEGMHAIIDKEIVRSKKSRVVVGQERYFFYNPMWKHFVNNSKAYGTYYYSSATPINYFWNIFDQILIRPDLIDHFLDEDIQIIVRAKDRSLIKENGVPDTRIGSDHLPIFFKLKINLGG